MTSVRAAGYSSAGKRDPTAAAAGGSMFLGDSAMDTSSTMQLEGKAEGSTEEKIKAMEKRVSAIT